MSSRWSRVDGYKVWTVSDISLNFYHGGLKKQFTAYRFILVFCTRVVLESYYSCGD